MPSIRISLLRIAFWRSCFAVLRRSRFFWVGLASYLADASLIFPFRLLATSSCSMILTPFTLPLAISALRRALSSVIVVSPYALGPDSPSLKEVKGLSAFAGSDPRMCCWIVALPSGFAGRRLPSASICDLAPPFALLGEYGKLSVLIGSGTFFGA